MWTLVETPLGPLRVIANRDAVTAVEFPAPEAVEGTPRSSVALAVARAAGRPTGDRCDESPLLREVTRQLDDYFAGDRETFDLPVHPGGTPFQLRVWEQLRGIGYGETASYGEIARRLGMTNVASRAVGLANGRNPVPILIPCHRVVGADGALTGYVGGMERKRRLLELEQHALF